MGVDGARWKIEGPAHGLYALDMKQPDSRLPNGVRDQDAAGVYIHGSNEYEQEGTLRRTLLHRHVRRIVAQPVGLEEHGHVLGG